MTLWNVSRRRLLPVVAASVLLIGTGCGSPEAGGPTATSAAPTTDATSANRPFSPPEPPLPDPKPDGLTVTLTKFVTLPPSKTNPPAPRGDKLDRYNRINFLGEVPDGSGRLYVPDLNGTLYLLKDGKPKKYLDVAKKVGPTLWTSSGFGAGFGFVAFHPDFKRNGIFYTVHTEAYGALKKQTPNLGPNDGAVVQGVITEWTASNPAANVFKGKRREVMRLAFPSYIHGMQEIAFNPYAKPSDADYGMLYVSVGDGGAVGAAAEEGQTSNVPQDLSVPQGKILRINPTGNEDRGWLVPKDNPFVGKEGALGEIYAYGLRDPYRFSWDSAGDHRMILGSMGENRAESIYDVHAGDNFGWPVVEGPFEAHLLQNCDVTQLTEVNPDFTYPVAAYSHIAAKGAGSCDDSGYAIIGGFVYRGRLKALQGQYVFGDGVTGRIFHIDANELVRGGALATVHELTLREDGKQVTMRDIASDPGVLTAGKPRVDLRFGMDGSGELYVLSKANGTIWRITDAAQN